MEVAIDLDELIVGVGSAEYYKVLQPLKTVLDRVKRSDRLVDKLLFEAATRSAGSKKQSPRKGARKKL